MMKERISQFVPLSPSLERGTVGQTPKKRDRQRDRAGTTSLKDLANQILKDSKSGTGGGTGAGQGCPRRVRQKEGFGTSFSEPFWWEIVDVPVGENLNAWIEFEERAAILEYDGGYLKEEAEYLARLEFGLITDGDDK